MPIVLKQDFGDSLKAYPVSTIGYGVWSVAPQVTVTDEIYYPDDDSDPQYWSKVAGASIDTKVLSNAASFEFEVGSYQGTKGDSAPKCVLQFGCGFTPGTGITPPDDGASGWHVAVYNTTSSGAYGWGEIPPEFTGGLSYRVTGAGSGGIAADSTTLFQVSIDGPNLRVVIDGSDKGTSTNPYGQDYSIDMFTMLITKQSSMAGNIGINHLSISSTLTDQYATTLAASGHPFIYPPGYPHEGEPGGTGPGFILPFDQS